MLLGILYWKQIWVIPGRKICDKLVEGNALSLILMENRKHTYGLFWVPVKRNDQIQF